MAVRVVVVAAPGIGHADRLPVHGRMVVVAAQVVAELVREDELAGAHAAAGHRVQVIGERRVAEPAAAAAVAAHEGHEVRAVRVALRLDVLEGRPGRRRDVVDRVELVLRLRVIDDRRIDQAEGQGDLAVGQRDVGPRDQGVQARHEVGAELVRELARGDDHEVGHVVGRRVRLGEQGLRRGLRARRVLPRGALRAGRDGQRVAAQVGQGRVPRFLLAVDQPVMGSAGEDQVVGLRQRHHAVGAGGTLRDHDAVGDAPVAVVADPGADAAAVVDGALEHHGALHPARHDGIDLVARGQGEQRLRIEALRDAGRAEILRVRGTGLRGPGRGEEKGMARRLRAGHGPHEAQPSREQEGGAVHAHGTGTSGMFSHRSTPRP